MRGGIDTFDIQRRFEKMGEPYAAGFFEEAASPFRRFARGHRRYLENCKMPPYAGEALYPNGRRNVGGLLVRPGYSYTVEADIPLLQKKDETAAGALQQALSGYSSLVPPEHQIGGNMYTHSFPNFRRLVRDGLDAYQKRIEKIEDGDIRCGLLDLLEGIRAYHARALEMVRDNTVLYQALEKVPFSPADTLYEALVCWNFLYYMDSCDNIGWLDEDLAHFYKGEDMTAVFRRFFENVDANDGWTGALGPNYNPLTLQCLQAVKGLRRPSLELRVTPDMPKEVWEAAINSIRAGGGQPSLYNETAYQQALGQLFPEIPQEDRLRFCGGGCTETMLTGVSNVGSLDAGINLALLFERIMQEKLPSAAGFEDFYREFIQECRPEIGRVLEAVSASQEQRARLLPQPMRTLLIDDCIDRGRDFNNGGARYNWSVINIAGLINVLDSLLVIRQLVFLDRVMDGAALLRRLEAGETFLDYPSIPRHGNDEEEANRLAWRLSSDICSVFDEYTPYSGGKFLPSSIQFATYAVAGSVVGATPDGRRSGEPLCDSIGAVHGNDICGVTALLNSAAALCQSSMAGTPVLNLKLAPRQTEVALKPLVLGYFRNGGMQVQITCVSREELLDAREHPEKYPNLIVRIGGYSEYFNRLTPELQQTVIDRTVYSI